MVEAQSSPGIPPHAIHVTVKQIGHDTQIYSLASITQALPIDFLHRAHRFVFFALNIRSSSRSPTCIPVDLLVVLSHVQLHILLTILAQIA
jgi:hypothetical protein